MIINNLSKKSEKNQKFYYNPIILRMIYTTIYWFFMSISIIIILPSVYNNRNNDVFGRGILCNSKFVNLEEVVSNCNNYSDNNYL